MIAKSIQLYLIKSFTNISVVLKRMNGCAFGIGRNITIRIESNPNISNHPLNRIKGGSKIFQSRPNQSRIRATLKNYVESGFEFQNEEFESDKFILHK